MRVLDVKRFQPLTHINMYLTFFKLKTIHKTVGSYFHLPFAIFLLQTGVFLLKKNSNNLICNIELNIEKRIYSIYACRGIPYMKLIQEVTSL